MERNYNFPITFFGQLEKVNDVVSKCRARVFYRGANRNLTYISDEFAKHLLSTISYAPIKGVYTDKDDKDDRDDGYDPDDDNTTGEGDYTDHGDSRDEGRIYGVVPETHNPTWEEFVDPDGVTREYACVDVFLYTALYKEASEIINKSLSMEIYPPSIKGRTKTIEGLPFFEYTEGSFLGLQVLGDDVEPCFEGAAFFALYEALIKTQAEKNVGGQNMITFKLSDDKKREKIFNLLNSETDTDGYRIYSYNVVAVYDKYAVIEDYKTETYFRQYYTKNEETEEVTLGEREQCFITDVNESEKEALKVVEEDAANYKVLAAEVEEKDNTINTLTNEKTEAETTIATLTTEKDQLTTDYNLVVEERDALQATIQGQEDEEKTVFVDKYCAMLTEKEETEKAEKLKADFADLSKYSLDEFKKEVLLAIEDSISSTFSLQLGVPNDEGRQYDGVDALINKYKRSK